MAIHTKLSPMYFKNISPTGIKYRMLLNEKKGRDLTQSYDKSPYTHKKIQKPTEWLQTECVARKKLPCSLVPYFTIRSLVGYRSGIV